ncbi:MAG: hypothetical protein WKG01_40570 [Kofleriaceae bacterium]
MLRRCRVVLLASLVSCRVRTPAPLDVAALVNRQGPVEARRSLALRVVAEPKDVAARLALATLADQQGRPSEAIEQLEAVVALDGPLGIRWRATDRARLARLVAARGRTRLQRGAPPRSPICGAHASSDPPSPPTSSRGPDSPVRSPSSAMSMPPSAPRASGR